MSGGRLEPVTLDREQQIEQGRRDHLAGQDREAQDEHADGADHGGLHRDEHAADYAAQVEQRRGGEPGKGR